MKYHFLKGVITAAALAATATMAHAEWAPKGPVKMLIAFAAGGSVDSVSRALAAEVTARRGWEIIPENVGGQGGVSMGVALMKEPNDGMTIGVTTDNSLAYNRLSMPTPPFTPQDFTMISTITGAQSAVIARPDRGWKTFGDVLEAMKGGKTITLAADAPRLADGFYLLGKANGVQFNIIQGEGGRDGMNSVMAGDVDLATAGGAQAANVAAGDLVELLNINPIELRGRPEVPSITDYNVDFALGALFMVNAPAGIPDEARAAWAEVIAEIVNDENSELTKLITRTFSGAEVIALDALDAHIAKINVEAETLLKATSE